MDSTVGIAEKAMASQPIGYHLGLKDPETGKMICWVYENEDRWFFTTDLNAASLFTEVPKLWERRINVMRSSVHPTNCVAVKLPITPAQPPVLARL